MRLKSVLYATATFVAPCVLLFILYALYKAEVGQKIQFYQFAWLGLLCAVLLMELRVRLGYRTRRGKLFLFHLIFAIPFFICLGILAFVSRPLWLIGVTDLLLLLLGIAGVSLFYRSIYSAKTS